MTYKNTMMGKSHFSVTLCEGMRQWLLVIFLFSLYEGEIITNVFPWG